MVGEKSGFGERVRLMRIKRNFTIEELAEILDISVSHMGLLEREERKPSFSLLIRLSVSLGVSSDYLLFGIAPETGENTSQIFISEGEVDAAKQDARWLDIDKEYALGIAVGHALKRYNLDIGKLSYIYAAVNYIAGKIR